MQTRLTPSTDPLGKTVTAELAAGCAPLGIDVHLQTNSARLLEAFEGAFGRYGQAGDGSPQINLRLLVDETFSATPPWPSPVVRADGDLLYISMGNENVIVADLGRRYAFGFLSPSMAEDTAVLRTSLLDCAVFAMATFGTGATHTYVHASAVARNGCGLVFSGPAASGKSTLAYACGRRGFRIVSDDVVYLRSEPDGLTAWGRPWHLRFLPDCVRFFPELERRSRLPASDKMEIEVEDFLPSAIQTHCNPSAVFFLRRSGTVPRIEPIAPDVAVDLLARDLIADLPGVTEMHCRTWRRLAEQGSYLLHYGEDPGGAVDLLEHFPFSSD